MALPAPLDGLHLVPPVRRDRQERLRLDRDQPDVGQLPQCLGPGQDPHVLPQHDHHPDPVGHHRAPAGVGDRVRGVTLQLPIQSLPADAVHRRKSPPGPGHHHAALPHVPRPAAAGFFERQRSVVRPVFRDHHDPHRVPTGLLHLRLEQLYEDTAQGTDGGGAGRRRVGPADVLAGDPAALPASTGGPCDARVHVHLQRLLLGADPDVHGKQAADHLGAE